MVGRCYTKARRTPLVVGVIPNVMPGSGGGRRSIRLPFGPYTITQLAALVITCAVLILSRSMWGGHGLADVFVVVFVPFTAAFALRHLHVDGRNPVAAAASIAVMLAAPRHGRLHGRAYRPAVAPRTCEPHLTVAVSSLEPLSPAGDGTPLPAEPSRAQVSLPVPAVAVASGVQALLTRPAPSKE